MAHGHIFEIYTIVAAIDDGMDLVFGFKNMAETEGRLNTRMVNMTLLVDQFQYIHKMI